MPNASLTAHRTVPSRRPRRSAFTLIEMLVVIGIILVLVGMSIVGFNQIARHTKAQHTKAALETAKALLSEFEASAGKTNVASFTGYWNNVTQTINTKNGRAAIVRIGSAPPYVNLSWDQYSALALAKLLELPTNKAIFDKLPSEQIQKTMLISGVYYYELLDGYGHPILFVPSVGLNNITAGGVPGLTNRYFQSDGLFRTTGTAANPRYFWMSAGADNDPAIGDDNQYSFDQ